MSQRSDPNGRPERVRYPVAGRAMREAGKRFARARASARDAEDRITVADATVLVTVFGLIGGYSRLSDRVALSQLAEETGLAPKTVSRALARLARFKVIEYVPGRGAGNLGVISLPHPEEERRQQLSPLEGDGPVEKADNSCPLSRTPSRSRKVTSVVAKGDKKGDIPRARVYSEKSSEKRRSRTFSKGGTRPQEGARDGQEIETEKDDDHAHAPRSSSEQQTESLLAALERAKEPPPSSPRPSSFETSTSWFAKAFSFPSTTRPALPIRPLGGRRDRRPSSTSDHTGQP